MLDIQWIRDHQAAFVQALQRRNVKDPDAVIREIVALDVARRDAMTRLQELQQQRNSRAKTVGVKMGQLKKQGVDSDTSAAGLSLEIQALQQEVRLLMQEGKAIAEEILRLEEETGDDGMLAARLSHLPNIPAHDVPEGMDEQGNQIIRLEGVKPHYDFTPQQHFDLGEALGQMDFAQASVVSGARFSFLTGALARLERALANFMLDVHREEYGYTEVAPPLLVRKDALYGTGQLPKFAEDLFRTTDDRWLIPTAEVSLTNLVQDKIVEEGDLPLRFTAWTPCFRSEAGSAGRDTRGLIRQHQFSKVELVSITTAEQGQAEHERMLGAAEAILKKLGLHYRVMLLCCGDMGFSAQKTYDIEVWLPGQNCFREISSVSYCGDFQARRMRARYRPLQEKKPQLLHTLNGSGLAVGRSLVAVLEHYQQKDGSIIVPEVLRPYMGGLEVIR